MSDYEGRWKTVRVETEEGIGWVILNRPEKRNAMSPTLNLEMRDVLETLELVQGGFHGFDVLVPDAAISRQFNSAWNEALKRAFARA